MRRIRGAGVERPAGVLRVFPRKRGRLIDGVLEKVALGGSWRGGWLCRRGGGLIVAGNTEGAFAVEDPPRCHFSAAVAEDRIFNRVLCVVLRHGGFSQSSMSRLHSPDCKLPRESQIAESRFELVDALLVWLNGREPWARRGARALFVGQAKLHIFGSEFGGEPGSAWCAWAHSLPVPL